MPPLLVTISSTPKNRPRKKEIVPDTNSIFKVCPKELTTSLKTEWLSKLTGVTLGSDAFFPFGDNVERAHQSGVQYIAQPGGSIRDDQVIETADKYGMVMAFTGMRLFHH